ncbi:hypothetical protein CSUI_003195 [Cystoisospora suis]|uniref:Transmembrane protein n=1 Tax=Cystoisospora suis TaxID=483139 RepID=A0A2C6L6G9_9APIC|nr:hypothetical protein CSUI_003195 [Cystoisospora suis]
MKHCLAKGLGALCLLLPLCFLPVAAAHEAVGRDSLRAKAGGGLISQGSERKEVVRAAAERQQLDAGEEEVTDERYFESSQAVESKSAAHWRLPSSSLFSKLLLKMSKTLQLHMIAAVIFVLWRTGGVPSRCLEYMGIGEARRVSTPESSYSSVGNEGCERLFGRAFGSDDQEPAIRVGHTMPSLTGDISAQMLTPVVPGAPIARDSAAPVSHGPNQSGVVGAGAGDDTAATGAPDENQIDDTTPSVEFQGDKVIIGKTWTTSDGTEKRGSTPAIKFSFEGKKYRIRPTEETRNLLEREGVLGRVRAILSKAPETTSGKKSFAWGKGEKETVQVFSGDVYEKGDDTVIATWEVYLPNGAFGIKTGTNKLEGEKTQEYFNLAAALAEAVHIMKTGERLAE